MDMDGTSPTTFFMMDEIGRKQILKEYDWSEALPVYRGSYEILYKTELHERFCLVMRRYAKAGDDTCYVMEYYPGTQGRIFMKGLSESNMEKVINEYAKRLGRKRRLPLMGKLENKSENRNKDGSTGTDGSGTDGSRSNESENEVK